MGKNANSKQPASLFPRDIPRLPDGYYSGDKPNPNLRAFVDQHLKERPYDPSADDYDVPAFNKPIETTKATAIYNMHTYWSKKPHDAIRQYIRHYTQPGDLVLDPFCGSGGTALAALMEGRKAIAIDRSPAATFITKNYCTPVDPDALREAFEQVKATVKHEIDWLYDTRCDRCEGRATTAYTVFSQVFQCPRCMERVQLFDCVEVDGETTAGKPKKVNVCPLCYAKGHEEIIRSQSQKFGLVPASVCYVCHNDCKPKRGSRRHDDDNEVKRTFFDNYDLGKLRAIEAGLIPHWYPRGYDMTGFSRYQRDALFYYGVTEVADLFTKRNLWALAALNTAIDAIEAPDTRDALLFAFTSILLKSSKMMAHNNDGIGRIQKGTYYLPQVEHDIHVLEFLGEAVEDMARGYAAIGRINAPMISTASSVRLDIPHDSIDYVFTDPPYAEKVQYGELNFVWEAWLRLDTRWHPEEIIVNEKRGKTEADWAISMKQVMAECHRVLKPGRSVSICYHDTSEGTWSLLQDLMAEAGFVTEDASEALYIESATKTTNQYFADKVNKRDLVISFRKPRRTGPTANFTAADGNRATFSEIVRGIIAEFLAGQPGSTKDRIYDEVVSRLVRAGQMQSHDFEQLLRSVADEVHEARKKDLFRNEDPNLFGTHVASRWYLKDTELGADEADRATADSAASRICAFLVQRSNAEMAKSEQTWSDLRDKYRQVRETLAGLPDSEDSREKSRLRKELRELQHKIDKLTGQRAEWQQHALHYSEIMEFYLPLTPKPRETLIELLEDYCYQTDEGHWRPPAGEDEAKAKADSRGQATRRKVNQLCKVIETNQAIPAALRVDHTTLATWLRYCKQAGLYAQGKTLYEKAGLDIDQLSDDTAAGVEEDYQTCVRMLARTKLKPPVAGRKAGS